MADAAARPSLTPDETRRWTRVGLLAALAMALGYLETFIPIPIPGVKLGLANIAILIALAQGDAPGALGVGVIKVLAAGLLFGNPLTMAFSAAGTALALAAMVPLSRLETMRLPMVSVIGALAHEAGQIAVAMAVLGTPLVWYSAPVLLVAGCLTGAACGVVASRTAALLADGPSGDGDGSPAPGPGGRATGRAGAGPLPGADGGVLPAAGGGMLPAAGAKAAIIVFALYCIALLHAADTPALVVGLCIAGAACIAGRVRLKTLVRALRPLVLILGITFIAQLASFQEGPALAAIGPVAITGEALRQTWLMSARLIGITGASIALMHLVATADLVDAIAWMLRPLRRLGLKTEGFVLALQVALQAVPLLADAARGRFANRDDAMPARELWRTVLPAFIADAYLRASEGQQP